MLAVSVFDYMHELQDAGFNDKQAEVQARHFEQFAQAIKEVKEQVKSDAFASKSDVTLTEKGLELSIVEVRKEIALVRKDLELGLQEVRKDLELGLQEVRKEIAILRYETLKFVIWTGIGCSVAIISAMAGMLAKGFHWF